jgi:hypothetical protein
MTTKRSIPDERTGNLVTDRALSAIKQNLDQITGQARNVERLQPLPATATLAELIARVNALTERLQ